MNRLVYAVCVDCSSLLCWMADTRVSLRMLLFAQISDLLHANSDARSLVHLRSHVWEGVHQCFHQPPRSRHDDELWFICLEDFHDPSGDSLGGGQEGSGHGRHWEVHLLQRSRRCPGLADTAEDEYGAADSSVAVIGPQHTSKANEAILTGRIDLGMGETDATTQGRDVHNVSLLACYHPGKQQAGKLNWRGQIELDDCLNFICRVMVKFSLGIATCIVHQHIYCTKGALGGGH